MDLYDFNQYLNEEVKDVVYPTNFKGMVQGAIGNIKSQIMMIAQELANEKASRNKYRHGDHIEAQEVDITRAINLVFHSDWKKSLKTGNVQEWAKTSLERASTYDTRSNKKNQRALRKIDGGKDDVKVNLDSIEFSRNNKQV